MGDAGPVVPSGFDKVRIRRLPAIAVPPIPPGGGRLPTPAGMLTQIIDGPSLRFLAHLEFKQSTSRGNHVHRNKVESLYIIQGSLQARFMDVENGQVFETVLEAGDFVTVLPGCAHAYTALEDSYGLDMADTPYDPEDTIAYRLQERTG